MRIANGSILCASTLLAIAAVAAPTPAAAQRGNDRDRDRGTQTMRCESDDDRRRVCNVDTRGGVQLVRQLSRSPCIEGRTWGQSRDGVWVDRGCRAEFSVSGGGWGGGRPGDNNGQSTAPFRCESRGNRTEQCAVEMRGRARLVRQLSDSPCIEGRSWGQDNRGVWVSGGCRAEFQVESRSWSRWR
jgi:hypothetical protein